MNTPSDRALRGSAWIVSASLIPMVVIRALLYYDEHGALAGSSGDALNAFALAFIILSFPLTGALILRRHPHNTIGWLLQGVGLVWAVGLFTDIYARYGLLVNPGGLPGAEIANALNGGIWAPAIGLMGTFLVLLYPDGHLPSPRWRPVAWLSAVTVVALTLTLYLTPGETEVSPVPTLRNPMGWESAQPVLAALFPILLLLLPLCFVACAAALVRRFARSHGVERQQLKWLAAAGTLVACLFLFGMTAPTVANRAGIPRSTADAWLNALDSLSFLSFALLPAAIGIAILRHGLYDIDVFINRAVVYGFLTASLAGVYLGLVLMLQLLLSPVTSQSDLAVAGSTLAVAALFGPARGRIQRTVDRRFYRNRYDAARTIDAFSSRLRNQLDLEAVGIDLRATVHETVQPAHVTLWLRP